MQVYDIKVRFMRKIQVRDYEPTESELTISAQLEDGEDPKTAIKAAFKILSEEVHTSLGLAPNTKLPTRGKGKIEGEATTTPAPTPAPASDKKAADKPQQAKAPAATDDIPGETTQAKPTAAQAQAASSADIPGETAPSTQTTATATAEDDLFAGCEDKEKPARLSKWIGEQVKSGKIASTEVAALYPKFGISRFADLKPEKCSDAKAAVEELINKKS